MASPERPLSPFMLGPYYRLQLTSVLSFLHRLTGVFLAISAFALAAWVLSVADGPESWMHFQMLASGAIGRIWLAGAAFSLSFHFFNGLRHLGWDAGWGFEIPRAYATGWAVVVFSLLSTVLICAKAFALLGGAA